MTKAHPVENRKTKVETETNSVEINYSGGKIDTIKITATWHKFTIPKDEQSAQLRGRNDLEEHGAHVEFSVDEEDTVAQLTGFYPETNKTGVELYRETLQAVRILPHAKREVADRVDVDVKSAHTVLHEQLEK